MRKIFFLFLIALISISPVKAQEIKASASIDTNNVLIGEKVGLTLKFQSNEKTDVIWPSIPDTLSGLEVLNRSDIDTASTENSYTLSRKLALTSFESGTFSIPEITFMYEKEGMNDLYPAKTSPLLLRFRTVQVDTTKAAKDIKAPLDEPVTLGEYLWLFVIGFALLAVAAGIYIYMKKFRKPKEPERFEYDPKIPPHVIALEALKQLDSEKLWQKGLVKKYYIRLTEIIRAYIEKRYKIPALEMTTVEIIEALKATDAEEEQIFNLQRVMELSDLVKFAKHEPLPNENSSSMKAAEEFVRRTQLLEKNVAQKEENIHE